MGENSETPTLAEDPPPPPPLLRPPSLPRPPSRVPLLEPDETLLGPALCRLVSFLAALGFHHRSSLMALVLSGFAFALLGIAVPVASICLSRCSGESCEEYQVERFEICVFVSDSSLAAISLICISRNLFKYGIRRFLFVDQHHGQTERFQKEYFRKIQDFFCLLLWWILPCLVVKITREIFRFVYIFHESIWKSIVVLLASIISWAYLIIIFLSACTLFNLVCNLQVIHFEDYSKLLERDADALVYLEEHTTGYGGKVNFTNAGGLAVSSVVQVVGVVLCLHAAAKISHRAQGVASVASRWHALITCSSCDSSQMRTTNSSANLEVIPANLLLADYSESDLESLDSAAVQSNSQLVSYMSSYHKRQALVMYLQSNPGGITIFGWTVDRALINTIFFLELTLVLFVLGITIVFPSK
ncbi:uncharacterized protein LOC103705753 [Phoenix dactylifera]|uniref:Uncharacterized protein LOC103705753 n=1 Tax=Phoenix dactylifera TaxID=42345 RepID=A0A8B8J431_PHODC|nr:uncharacterized protein LOC103705753 [Phoenix dactylifera]